ncbi:hypothetical protein HCJ99_34035 [Streptomyces sp. C1-2]|nr:hypothetical protein [Streptomyces sp. C1-2]
MKLPHYWKAVVGGVAAGAASLATALQDGTVTAAEGITAVLAALAAAGITWAVPNKPEPGDGV